YTVLSENYDKYYDSKFGTIFGACLGIPVSSKINLFAKLSYFENEAIPTSDITSFREGTAILKQVLFNGGIQFKIITTRRVNLYLQSGLTAAIIDEERKDENGVFTYEIEGNGNLGIFVGGILEVNLGNSPFSMISEFNYIYSWSPLLEYDETYKAINFVAGLRYYLAR
ncbi:MAG: hypothetical protein GY936_07050, partial [Ignavibacteriae bacterium]|nr:hypothetical protein [Ignavibacteriota bacterium]